MPSRQRLSSSDIALSSSPRSITPPQPKYSLRRLSSFANLNHLNPFTRRRSSHSTQASSDDDGGPLVVNQQSQKQQRRQSYKPLPEDPLPALPKSRTFSNLPLTRNRHASKPRTSVGAPSQPPSRIPTPSAGVKSKSRLASATKSILKVGARRGLTRSDTEPLLLPRSTSGAMASSQTLKENISLTSVKQAEPHIVFSRASEMRTPMTRNDTAVYDPWTPDRVTRRPRSPGTLHSAAVPKRDSFQPLTPRAIANSKTPRRSTAQSESRTPTTLIARARRQTMLPSATPRQSLSSDRPQRLSFSSDIQARHLLSPCAVPTPPPFRHTELMSSQQLHEGPISQIDLASEVVTQSQSTAYWSGRLMSQMNRQRTEAFRSCLAREDFTEPYPQVDLNICLKELQKKCVTEAARLSFSVFKAKVYVTKGVIVPSKSMSDGESESESGKEFYGA